MNLASLYQKNQSRNTTSGRRRPPKKRLIFQGHTITVYGVGWLAILAGKHIQTIRNLEYKGILPKPIFEDTTGIRYYTSAELRGYSELIKNFPIAFGPNVKNNWPQLAHQMITYQNTIKLALRNDSANWTKLAVDTFPGEQAIVNALSARPRTADVRKMAQRIIGNFKNES